MGDLRVTKWKRTLDPHWNWESERRYAGGRVAALVWLDEDGDGHRDHCWAVYGANGVAEKGRSKWASTCEDAADTALRAMGVEVPRG